MTTIREDEEAYVVAKRKNVRVQRYAKALAAQVAQMEQDLWERMEAEGEKEHRIDDVGKVTRNEPTWYAQVQDRRAFQPWAQVHRPGLIRSTEEKALLNQLVAERMRDHQPLPPGIGAYPKRTVSVRK